MEFSFLAENLEVILFYAYENDWEPRIKLESNFHHRLDVYVFDNIIQKDNVNLGLGLYEIKNKQQQNRRK